MKVVKEHIHEAFKEDADPIKDMKIGNIGIYKDLESRGFKFHFTWDGGEEEKRKAIDNMREIKKVIDKLVEVGCDIKDMQMSHAHDIYIMSKRILSGNRVIFECINEEDAQHIINIALKFSIWQYDNLHIGEGRDQVHVSIYPTQHVWLDNLIENRKKYKDI